MLRNSNFNNTAFLLFWNTIYNVSRRHLESIAVVIELTLLANLALGNFIIVSTIVFVLLDKMYSQTPSRIKPIYVFSLC